MESNINNFGIQLKSLRISNNKSLDDVASFLAIDKSMLYDIEIKNSCVLDFETCKKLDDFFNSDGKLYDLAKLLKYKQYFTSSFLSKYIIDKCYNDRYTSILEPGCGDGSFIYNFSSEIFDTCDITGIEIDKDKAGKFYNGLKLKGREPILTEDNNIKFKGGNIIFDNFIFHDFKDKKFDLVIGNPPFGYDEENKFYLDIEFVRKSIDLLKDGGRVVFLLETKFVHGVERFNRVFKDLVSLTKMYFIVRRPSFNEYSGTGTRDCSIFEFCRKSPNVQTETKWIEFSKNGELLTES